MVRYITRKSTSLARAITKRMQRLAQRFDDEGMVIFPAHDKRGIDDGGEYGDVFADTRPDWMKDEGWELMVRLDDDN